MPKRKASQPAKRTPSKKSSKPEAAKITHQQKPDNAAPAATPEQDFPIVGIGASAGGLAAIEQFFTNMPDDGDPNTAFVLVQHLSPNHKSILANLVKNYTSMHVCEVEDGMTVEPNCIYVIPPNKDMGLLHKKLQLLEPQSSKGVRLSIDTFFRSLAQDQRDRAICIVLAGTGTDGTLGLKAIKGEGGMAMVQDPSSTRYDGMPRSAIATGLADYVLPPDKMPKQLLAYIGHSYDMQISTKLEKPKSETSNMLQKIFILLRAQTGHDFSYYKQNTIRRRIERRLAVNQIMRLDHYVRYLQQNPIEIETLFKEFLIGVTSFFRDSEAFETLEKKMLVRLLKNRSSEAGSTIRIWVPGCSTGEEAYSLAILLREKMDELKREFRIQIFATDIDSEAIEIARAGLYPNSIAADVSEERLRRFFSEEDNHYRIKKSIRDMVVFAEQSVIEDPPFSKLDVISCRNLLIYLGSELQRKVIPLFHYALNQDGFLFLGNSETIGEFTDSFAVLDRKWKLYRRKGIISPRPTIVDFHTPRSPIEMIPGTKRKEHTAKVNIREAIEQTLLAEHTPACAIVGKKGEVIYIHGRIGKYLEPASGEATLNIVKMARQGLRIELTSALRKVAAQQEIVRYENLKVRSNGEAITVNLVVKPMIQPAPINDLVMVLFEDVILKEKSDSPSTSDDSSDKDQRIANLERELKAKEEHLQTTVEELETANEELKSTNEELQSTNEELQSTNEELETSKEELQSVNEELVTVNAELQKKVDELSTTNNDMNNLMAGTGIATIFVDLQLNIQRFTPTATKVINLIQTDVGRPVGHIVSNLEYDHLVQDTQAVLDTLIPREIEVQTKEGKWYLMRILPYRTQENVIDGAVITFGQISQQKENLQALETVNQQLKESRDYAENIIATIREPLLVLDSELKVASANRAFYDKFETSPNETKGRTIFEPGNMQWDIPELRKLLKEILPEQNYFEDFEVRHTFPKIGERVIRLNAREMYQAEGKERLILLAMEDITGSQ